ncbi:MAG: PepSY-associated TM helix domain-containing protein [Gammaproteobacteria bacterium]
MPRAQSSRLKRVLFQVHLWSGMGLGLYVLLISLSGSVIVFRREMDRALCPGPGMTTACEPAFVTWLADLHDNLLGGHTGRLVNGVGAILIAVLAIAGLVLWWPGRSNWWRRMSLKRGVGGRRFTLDLHNMLGFWLFVLIFVWALSGIYFAFPDPFNWLAERFEAGEGETSPSFFVQDALAVLARLHFGRAYGLGIKIAWGILGLVPCVLFVTGALMWWWRVIRSPRVTR